MKGILKSQLLRIALVIVVTSFAVSFFSWYQFAYISNTKLFVDNKNIFLEENALLGILVIWPFWFVVTAIISYFVTRNPPKVD